MKKKKKYTAMDALEEARNKILNGIIQDVERVWKQEHGTSVPDFEHGETYKVVDSDSGTNILVDLLDLPGYREGEFANLEVLGVSMDDKYQIKILFSNIEEEEIVCEKSVDDPQISLELLAEIATWLETYKTNNRNCSTMTKEEFDAKWKDVDPSELPDEQFHEFIDDCFAMYEAGGFLEKFDSPYDDEGEHNGMGFKVLRRTNESEADLETLPTWLVQFENGDTAYCYPEEICVIEHQKTDDVG